MRDLRKYARQTNARLITGGLLLLFGVGIGLIYLFYGARAAGMGFACLALGLTPLLLIWLALAVVGWITKQADQ